MLEVTDQAEEPRLETPLIEVTIADNCRESSNQTPDIERTVSQLKSVTSSFVEPQSNTKSASSEGKQIEVIDE